MWAFVTRWRLPLNIRYSPWAVELQAFESHGGTGASVKGTAAGGVGDRDAVACAAFPCKDLSATGECAGYALPQQADSNY